MQMFSLGLNTPINGIYLNTETIELLNILQCKNVEELKKFVKNCSQLSASNIKIDTWDEKSNLEELKKELVEEYKKTILSLEESIKNREQVVRKALLHCGINNEDAEEYIETFKKEGYDGVKKKLKLEKPEQYAEFVERSHRFIGTERDQMKSVSYEELLALNDILSNHNTILVASGRYYDVTKKLYDEEVQGIEKYDFYHVKRGLDFCYKNGKYARYHTLLDKQTMEKHLIGKPKKVVLKELKDYVKESIDFINKYNEGHKIGGKGVITSVDLFNEIISFDRPYKNMWNELYDISTEELIGVFQYALDNKPKDVTYVYNEPFLENPDRRKAVIEQLKEINNIAPGLIDTIGTQMHIEMSQSAEEVQKCFEELKELSELGITTQITEFDMCLPEKFSFDDGRARKESELVELFNTRLSNAGISISSIEELKKMKMNNIIQAIKNSNIQLDGITYWSVSDTLDHNLQRTNSKTIENGLRREIIHTRFSGLYSGLEETKKKSLQSDIGEK